MPRYFFDCSCDQKTAIDEDGLELASPAEARVAALEALPDLLKESLPDQPAQELSISVRDQSGRLVFTTSLFLSMRWGYL
jgi:ABC-type uncharacterized transport system YnjBCD ATPase subunit